jgi:hypothetical protein
MISGTLYAEREQIDSKDILKNPENYDKVTRAWAFWAQAALGMANQEVLEKQPQIEQGCLIKNMRNVSKMYRYFVEAP